MKLEGMDQMIFLSLDCILILKLIPCPKFRTYWRRTSTSSHRFFFFCLPPNSSSCDQNSLLLNTKAVVCSRIIIVREIMPLHSICSGYPLIPITEFCSFAILCSSNSLISSSPVSGFDFSVLFHPK